MSLVCSAFKLASKGLTYYTYKNFKKKLILKYQSFTLLQVDTYLDFQDDFILKNQKRVSHKSILPNSNVIISVESFI